MKKETYYGLDKGNSYKVWSIWTEGNQLFIEHGKENGKLQLKQEVIQGKNIGRSNETAPEKQAELEAQSRINKQVDKGYRANKADLEELPLLPMLASDYHKQGHRIKFPCLVSPKLDGVRCLAYLDGDEVVLLSRGGKEYDVPHIKEQLKPTLEEGFILDGEIYIHDRYLEEITSAVKRTNPQEEIDKAQRKLSKAKTDEEIAKAQAELSDAERIAELRPLLEFIAFDVVNDKPFSERHSTLQRLSDDIKVLAYLFFDDEDAMKKQHKHYVENGYEGIMLRNLDGQYESGKRSADLQKYKEFFDDEFKILAVVEDRNGNAVFTVKNKFADNIFNVSYGDFDQRKRFLEETNQLIGKMITVKYQALFKDTKIPQFPTGVAIRDYE